MLLLGSLILDTVGCGERFSNPPGSIGSRLTSSLSSAGSSVFRHGRRLTSNVELLWSGASTIS